ncbi:pre-B-cell leukemia transcription factor-interacting protein 1 isoform X2 [Oryzias latipes]|uniref:pre-B-cell leukemia transcription factor-interacting protein 1 isoform X2 n=1 Tax=Oryzias latipes TaxID=8090 RepID=UPI0005CBE33F|nr:pre-B-cell leukemia transcription factor-interacting protein 1 isoform X2 [Oryzias latipes]
MSDSSNSTGSSGSSTNSWTLLSPEEAAAIESVGPVDDGTESLGDAPSLSEEVAGAAAEFKPADIAVETVLSEEGHQVCQETSPESSEGPIPSSPARMSPRPSTPLDPPDLDLESQPPVIHDIVTTSPSDNEHLGGVSFVTNIDLSAPLDVPEVEVSSVETELLSLAPPTAECSAPAEVDTSADSGSIPSSDVGETPDRTAEPDPPTETITATSSFSVEAESGVIPERKEPPPPLTRQSDDEGPAPETRGLAEEEEEEEEAAVKPEMQTQEEEEEEEEEDPSGSFDDGLRRRNVASFDAARPRTSDEDDDEEEVELKLPERGEEKPWFSVNKCIVGALVLLFLGSLFLSGDFDASELSDGEQSQDWLGPDPQDMKALMDKLLQENQEIRQLESQLQTKTEELDLEVRAAAASGDERGKAELETENAKLKEELGSLPELKEELEQLRARVTELSRLSVPPPPPSSSRPDDVAAGEPDAMEDAGAGAPLQEELQRQKGLLMDSKKRLEGMKKDGGHRKQLQDGLEEVRRKLSQHVESLGKKKPQETRRKEGKGKRSEGHRKEEKKEWKHGKEGGWKGKEEEWKPPKENSHKEAWRKHQDEWERKKSERRVDREERRKEKPWHSRSHPPHPQQQQPPRQQHHSHFWKDQELKLHRSVRPQLGCSSLEDCAAKEGLYPVELPEFEELLEGYLSKLERSSAESKSRIRKLTAEFFEDGVFIHDRALFSSFAEDVADVLEDMVDLFEAGKQTRHDSLEEEMEEFEREAMWKFAATA